MEKLSDKKETTMEKWRSSVTGRDHDGQKVEKDKGQGCRWVDVTAWDGSKGRNQC